MQKRNGGIFGITNPRVPTFEFLQDPPEQLLPKLIGALLFKILLIGVVIISTPSELPF